MPSLEEDQGSEGYYLFWALLGGSLVLAFGSSALLSKMAERPELAQADPLLTGLLKAACYGSWSAVLVLGLFLIRQALKDLRRPLTENKRKAAPLGAAFFLCASSSPSGERCRPQPAEGGFSPTATNAGMGS